MMCFHFFVIGSGRVRYINGSNVMETYSRQTSKAIVAGIRVTTCLFTFRTNQSASVLSLEQVYDDAVIPFQVSFPAGLGKLGHFPVSTSFPVRFFDVRLFDDAVKIFVKTVKQEGYEFLRVVLLVAAKLGCKAL